MVNYENSKIYQVVNTLNDKIYIGSTCNELRVRFRQHKARSNQTKYKETEFYTCLKENKDCFKIILLEYFPCNTKQELEKREYEVIQLKIQELGRDKIYNLCLANNGEGNHMFGNKNVMFGKHHTDEAKKKISEVHKGKTISEELKMKISTIHKGKQVSDVTKQKMSEAIKGEKHPFYGKTHSEETKLKISLSSRGEKNGHFKRGSIYIHKNKNVVFKWFTYDDDGTKLRKIKSYSINKYGKEEALKLAQDLQNQVFPIKQ